MTAYLTPCTDNDTSGTDTTATRKITPAPRVVATPATLADHARARQEALREARRFDDRTGRPVTAQLVLRRSPMQRNYSTNPVINFLHLNRIYSVLDLARLLDLGTTSFIVDDMRKLHPSSDTLDVLAFAFKLDPFIMPLATRSSAVSRRQVLLEDWLEDKDQFRERHQLSWYTPGSEEAATGHDPQLSHQDLSSAPVRGAVTTEQVETVLREESTLIPGALLLPAEQDPRCADLLTEVDPVDTTHGESSVAVIHHNEPGWMAHHVEHMVRHTPQVETIGQWNELFDTHRRVHRTLAMLGGDTALATPKGHLKADTFIPTSIRSWLTTLRKSVTDLSGDELIDTIVLSLPTLSRQELRNPAHGLHLGVYLSTELVELISTSVTDPEDPSLADYISRLSYDLMGLSFRLERQRRETLGPEQRFHANSRMTRVMIDVTRQYGKAILRGITCPHRATSDHLK